MRRMLVGCLLSSFALSAWAAYKVPPQSGAFVSYCKTNSKGCNERISDISFAMRVTIPIDHKWCPTKEADDPNALAAKVVQWLTARPETNNTKTDDAIQLALARLYPCKR